MLLKTYKIRIYPNKAQEILINKTFGCCRLIYNDYLSITLKDKEENKKRTNWVEYCNVRLIQLKKDKEFLSEVYSQSLQNSVVKLNRAIKEHFTLKKGFPKFKKKSNDQSYNIPQGCKVKDNKVYLPKVGWVKFRDNRTIYGKIKTVTITKDCSGRYYACVNTEQEHNIQAQAPVSEDNTIGIDLGLTDYVTLSTGEKIENPKHYKKEDEKIQRLKRKMSKQKYDKETKRPSKRREKTRVKIAKLHRRIVDSKNDFLHKLSTRIVSENQAIVLENLKVGNMMKNHKLTRSVGEASWYKFKEMLRYKAEWYGKTFFQVDTFFPSSKLCSCCGFKNDKLELKDRKWECNNCGVVHDRDINASINIKHNGLNTIMNRGTHGDSSGKLVVSGQY